MHDPKYQSGQECQVHFPAGETVREAGLSLAVSQIFLVKPVDLLGSQCLVVFADGCRWVANAKVLWLIRISEAPSTSYCKAPKSGLWCVLEPLSLGSISLEQVEWLAVIPCSGLSDIKAIFFSSPLLPGLRPFVKVRWCGSHNNIPICCA